MKYRIIQISLLMLTVALIIGFAPRSGDAQETGKVTVEWGSDINIPPAADVKKMEARRLVNKAVGETEFVQLSNKVLQKSIQRRATIDKDRVERVGDNLAWRDKSDPSSFIMQDSVNGHLVFSNQVTKFVAMDQVNLPTKTNAINIAKTFVKDLNLAPTDFESKGELLNTSGLYTLEVDKNGIIGEETQKLITLSFGRKLDGFQVNGGGSKLVLDIGHEGKVVNLEKKWNAIQTRPLLMETAELKIRKFNVLEKKSGMMAPIKLRPIEREKLELGEIARPGLLLTKHVTGNEVKNRIIKMLQDEWTTPDLIKVNSIELVYFDRGGSWIQPAYAFQADIFWGDDVAHYLFHIPALRNAPEAIIADLFIDQPHLFKATQEIEVALED